MLYRLFLILLALNLATMFAKVQADEVDQYLVELSESQIGVDNTNTVPTSVDRGDALRRLASMLGNQWLKDLVGVEQALDDRREDPSLGSLLRESEYDVQVSEDDVLVSMTFRF